jgi:hypothetical protein
LQRLAKFCYILLCMRELFNIYNYTFHIILFFTVHASMCSRRDWAVRIKYSKIICLNGDNETNRSGEHLLAVMLFQRMFKWKMEKTACDRRLVIKKSRCLNRNRKGTITTERFSFFPSNIHGDCPKVFF